MAQDHSYYERSGDERPNPTILEMKAVKAAASYLSIWAKSLKVDLAAHLLERSASHIDEAIVVFLKQTADHDSGHP